MNQLLAIRPKGRVATLAVMLLVLLLQVAGTSAQSHDVRLSEDIPQPLLTSEAEIQSAASIGSITLAVWGSTASDGVGVRPVLYGQFLYDHEPLNTPFVVTSDAARPTGFVQVIALSDRFLVVWNDRRGSSPVTWLTRIDKFGAIKGEERLIDSGIIAEAGAFVAPISGGYILYWNIGKPDSLRVQGRVLNSDGNFSGPAFPTGFSFLQQMVYSPAGSDSLYADCGENGVYYVDSAGGWNRITALDGKVFSIGPDGSRATIDRTSILVYTSIRDTIPSRTIRAESLVGGQIPGTNVAIYDPFGRLGVVYFRYTIDLNQNTHNGYSSLSINSYISFLDSEQIVARDIPLGSIAYESFNHAWVINWMILPGNSSRFCFNSMLITIPVRSVWTFHYGSVTNYGDDTTYYSAVVSYNKSQRKNAGTNNVVCSTGALNIPIAQRDLSDPYQSTILVIFKHDTVRLTVAAGLVSINTVEWTPTISSTDTSFLVSWFRSGIDSVINLARWNPQSSGAIEPVATLSLKRYRKIDSVTTRTSMQLLSSGGMCFAAIHVDSLSSPTSKRAFAQHNSLLRADQDGWHSLYETDTTEADSINKIRSVTVDLDDHSALVVAGGGGDLEAARNIHVAKFDARGVQRWRADSFPDVKVGDFVALPLSEDYFFVGTRWSTSLYRGSNPLGTLDHPDSVKGLESRFLSLFKGKYLQWYVTKGRLDVEMFDTTFQRVGVISLPAGITAVSNSIVLQNPVDSGFAIVYGKNDGLHLTVIDKNLKLVMSDTIISESRDTTRHPSAVYVGDTLTVVWESYRKGVIDIYGTSRVVPAHIPPASREASPTSSQHISRLRPNPASDRILVDLTMPPPSGATWQILDATGGSIMRGDILAGSMHLDIATATLPSGYYLLSLEIAGERNVQGFVVQR